MDIEIDDIFRLAQRYVENTGTSVFLTGKAGTGKTTFLKYITEHTTKRFVVLAPTGVAAINAGGQTIHSFFLLPLCPYLPDVKELITEYQIPEQKRNLRKDRINIIKTLDLLIIDEISMVRADLLDAVDMMLRRYRRNDLPFGGVQLLMIGDAQQLSPVVKDDEKKFLQQVYPSPYFFYSKALRQLGFMTIELAKVHRQKDAEFLDILNAIRENRPTRDILNKLNARVGAELDGDPIRLMTHNRQADDFNSSKLAALPSQENTYNATIEGEYSQSSYPTDEQIRLKKGARVMFIRNDPNGQYYNGKLGTVQDLCLDGSINVKCDDETYVNVSETVWENVQYSLNSDSGEIEPTVVGRFTQIPLRTAWAITIHKSQGLTFEKVIIDAGAAFAFGQVYVALSRCRSLEGISLMAPIGTNSLYTDEAVAGFNAAMPSLSTAQESLTAYERGFEFSQIRSAFDFEPVSRWMWRLMKLWQDNLHKLYEAEEQGIRNRLDKLREVSGVAEKFRNQITGIERGFTEDTRALLNERLAKAAGWFGPVFEDFRDFFGGLYGLSIDNKDTKKKVKEDLDALMCELEIFCGCYKMITERGFCTAEFGRIRTACITADRKVVKKKKLKKVDNPEAESCVNEELRERLTQWRAERFKEENVPAYHILFQTTLLEIASKIPTTREELLAINGIGELKFQKYGADILEICRGFKK